MQAPFFPEIETPRLRIRPMTARDLPALVRVNADDQVTRYLPFPSWRSMHDAEGWMGSMLRLQEQGNTFCFVVAERDGRVIGNCFLFHLERDNARAEIGYALARAYWGRGYMREAMTAFIDRAFGDLRLRRLEAEIDVRNASSAGLLARLGFHQEGLLRERWNLRGEVSDASLYGLLRGEWEARRDILTATTTGAAMQQSRLRPAGAPVRWPAPDPRVRSSA
ncbi:GNAT family N-acetyltransferase [Noviherbaspirillum galbum]|uniref:GNAT family N-acetyltransferase n=1 Tax=Noviherbaspirillum galbum TaxID=2709383 RepID=A0A6B3SL17_9BURK|nr:GNAT family N-acetyltransferase [Noviherbaspirillum galbum]NEX61447.1 GNAT family N-acetyltransferase [Noviherbaspirillum galbum]